jgi:hypothetical protein
MQEDRRFMNLIIIIVKPTVASRWYPNLGERLVKTFGGDDCHSLEHTWIIRTMARADDVYSFILAQKLVHPDDAVIVATLAGGKWLARGAKSVDDCFQG